MIFSGKKAIALLTALTLSAAVGISHVTKAFAGTTVCTKVDLAISQEATLEREAFDAALGITNEFPSYGLEDFRVDIVIKDPGGNLANDLFYVKVNSKENITAVDGTGIVQPATTANVHWLIIPSNGAGGVSAAGLKYSVRADISYKLNGVYQSVSTYEDSITVKPQPALKLEYVLPFEVFGEEPLTTNVTEAVEPFYLGLRFTNVGYGTAKSFKIDSGSPVITSNAQGLAVDVALLGTYLGSTKLSDTFLIPFGNVAAGGVAQASWLMSTTLSGRFIKFNASFTHADELGGQLTSLVQETDTYTLVKDVLVDLPGRDAQFDFLVNTNTSRDTMYATLSAGGEIIPDYILESDQSASTPVAYMASELSGTLGGANTSVKLTLPHTTGSDAWVYSSVTAPLAGKARLLSAVRSDGKTINSRNVWISKHFNKELLAYTYRLCILDYNPPTGAVYTLNFSLDSVDSAPTAVADLNIASVQYSVQSAQAGLNWSATGEDGASGSIYGGRYLIQTATTTDAVFSTATAQISFSTNTESGAIQNYLLSDLTGNTSYYVRLWLQDTGGNISTGSNVAQLYVLPNPPTSLTFGTISSSTLAIAWAAGNNSAPITYGVWVDTDAAEPVVAASPFKAAGDLAYSFAGLKPNTTYSIYGQAKNPDTGAVSAQTVLGSTVTYAAQPGILLSSSVFLSSITVSWASGGNPEGTDYLVQLSTASDWSALTAETLWVNATTATFNGLRENTTYYARAKARNFANVETDYSALGSLKTGLSDVLPPVTAISFAGPSFGLEPVYVSSRTEMSLAAYDDAISSGDRMGTVADMHYAVDSDTFSVYAGSFSIADGGAHVVRYFGMDTAGNTEAVKTSSITVDNIAPSTVFDVQGSSLIINSNLYVAAAASVTITAADAMSGVRAIYYTLNGSTAVAVSPLLLPATAGGHVLAFYSVDNVGNVGLENSATYYVDLAAPVSSITLTGVLKDGYYADSVTIALAASDVGTGVLGIYYSVDAEFSTTTARTYTAPFILGVGTHSVTYTATDYVGNQASMTVVDVNVATSTDITVIMPLSGPIGIPFVIAGTDFGAYSSGITKVLIGGTTAPLTLWSTTTIKGTVPGTLAAGEHTVVVMRGTTTITDVAPFTITVPVAETVTPSSGPIGMPFVISGISFGNYEAGKTQVLLGGTTCPLTLWTDTQIKGAVPGSLAAGDYGFVVERNINGGVVDTSTLPFKVIAPVLDSIAPSTASIGVGFTLTGSGFGNYVAGYTRVLMGGTTTPLTLWTDNVIKGTVPGTLTSGTYEVAVEREFNNSIVRTSTVAFTLVQPEAQAVTPSSGAIGVTFTITGVNFGNYVANYTKVLIGGTTAPVSLWSDTKIQGAVPGSLAAGDYDLVVERSINGGDVTTAPLAFKVVVPELYDLSPASGAIGVPFTLSGANFGNYSANYTRVLINGTTTPLALWTDVKIQGTIPGSLANGVYPLQVERRTADGGLVQTSTFSFEVVGITISSMSPISGPIGQVFTIYGGNFGNYSAGYTKVLMGGTTTLVSLWTDAKIQGTVPGNLTDGDYPVIVERTLNGGVVQSSSLTFTVASPVMYGLSPSSGPIGLPFTLTGLNFGNYSAGYTKVLIGGATAPLTLWTDTKVQGTIPGALAAGDHELYLERALNGGVVRTSTAVFTVGAPYLDSVNPSTVSVQAVYTLAGYNFGNYSAGYTKVLVNGSTTTLTLWTDTKIQGKLPYLLAGTYPVQVQRALNGGLSESATAYVTVVEPVISSMTPVSGLARATINLYGSGFGAYESGFTKLLMDGTTCAISLWNDTRITGTVPTALAYGTHTVVAARGIAYSNGADFLLTAYTASMLKAITALGEFVLGEVYVYPNPAKGGVVPIFHIECGTADSVKIEVYTISGQAVHEYTITGAPQLITDSGGSSYAYEYAWRGHIASGVYLYRIEAERSGRKLKKTGKFAVVR